MLLGLGIRRRTGIPEGEAFEQMHRNGMGEASGKRMGRDGFDWEGQWEGVLEDCRVSAWRSAVRLLSECMDRSGLWKILKAREKCLELS